MTNLIIGFTLGFIISRSLTYLLSLGRGVIIIKQLQYIVAGVFTYIEECMIEASIYKELAMDETNLSEREKQSRRVLNNNTINIIKDNSMKGFLNLWPDSYQNLLEYRNWDEMKTYLEKEVKIKKETT